MQHAFRVVAERAEGRALKPSEVSAFWRARALKAIAANPTRWLRLELRKLLLFWNAREVWNNQSIEIIREFSWVLRAPLLTFAAMAPLALVGMGLARSRFRELFPMYAMVGVFVATALLLFVLARYRVGVVPILTIFAAYAVTTLVRCARERRYQTLGLAAGWLVVLAVIVHHDMGEENLYMAYFNLGNKYRELERYEEAIAAYERSLAIDPNYIGSHNNLALAYEGAGRNEEAIERWREVFRRAERMGSAPHVDRAARHLRNLLGLPPDWEPGDPVSAPE
jgi:tetratricopeptide (TPR) repeat protein